MRYSINGYDFIIEAVEDEFDLYLNKLTGLDYIDTFESVRDAKDGAFDYSIEEE